MLLSYSVSNFRSFRKRAEVSLCLTEKAAVKGWTRTSPSGQRVTTALATMGANGAGKTTLLQPLAFLAWFLPHSFSSKPDAPIPVRPHFTGTSYPTDFEVLADGPDGTVWRYTLRVTPSRVLHESLHRKKDHWRYVFERDWNDDTKSYVVKQQDFGLAQSEAVKVRPNASLISWAAQYGVETAQQVANVKVTTNLTAIGRESTRYENLFHVAEFYSKRPALREKMQSLLCAWDLGLSAINLQEVKDAVIGGEPQNFWAAFGLHRTSDGGLHSVLMHEESSGTKTAFVLLARLLQALEDGALVIIDELESDLHPHMIEPILELFDREDTNPRNAQIIFTCHSPEVLRVLQKSQVALVEKNENESEAWRLDTMKGTRADDNRVAKYLSGAYGALPRL